MSNLKTASKAVAWTALQGWGAQLIGFLVFALLARFLTPEEFGLVAMAMVFIAFTQIFVDQGLSIALIQRHDLTEKHTNTAFWTNIAAGILLTITSFILSNAVAEFYKVPELAEVIRYLSLLLILNSLFSVQSALFRKDLNYKPLAISSLSGSVVSGLIGVTMAIKGYGVWSLVAQQIILSLVRIICLWTISSWRPKLYWRVPEFKELFNYSVNVLGINIFEFFNRYADNFLIGYVLGPTALGYYALAYKFYQTLSKLLGGLASQVAFSSFSAFQHDLNRVKAAYYSSTRLMAFVTFPMFFGAAVIAFQIFTLLFGKEWENSILVFQILMIVAVIEAVFYFNGSVMMALGKPDWRLKINMLNAIVNVIGFSIAVRWGIEYVALAYVLRTYLLSPIPLLCVKKLVNISVREFLNGLLIPALCSAVMTTVVYVFNVQSDSTLSMQSTMLTSIGLGLVSYSILAAIFMQNNFKLIFHSVKSITK